MNISDEQVRQIANTLSSLLAKHDVLEVNVMVTNATGETTAVAQQISTAFFLAQRRSPKMGQVIWVGPLDFGITIRSGEKNWEIASGLEAALIDCKAVSREEIHVVKSQGPDDFLVLIKK